MRTKAWGRAWRGACRRPARPTAGSSPWRTCPSSRPPPCAQSPPRCSNQWRSPRRCRAADAAIRSLSGAATGRRWPASPATPARAPCCRPIQAACCCCGATTPGCCRISTCPGICRCRRYNVVVAAQRRATFLIASLFGRLRANHTKIDPMHFTPESFRAWPTKRVTLLGMSGVGKTHLSSMLRGHDWFHFSGDYRIGTRYLDEPILDIIKQQAMQVRFLRDLLRNDWIDIKNNIKIHDLGPVLTFVGKLGGPEWGGLPLDEFTRRQAAYRDAEIAAMRDVPGFIRKGQEIYGYPHLVNDVGGSLCELDEPGVDELVAEHTLILYTQTNTR